MKKQLIAFSVLIVLALFLAGCGAQTTIYPPQGQQGAPTTAPSAPATAPASTPSSHTEEGSENASSPVTSSDTMPQVKLCNAQYGIGWVPGSCEIDANKFEVTLKASGSEGINGIAFYVNGSAGVTKIFKDSTKVSDGGTQLYSFSIPELESALGGKVEEVTAFPIANVNGVDSACINHRLLIISSESCKGS